MLETNQPRKDNPMSKLYRVDMNIDVSKCTPNGGMLMKQVDKEEDSRGFKERTGSEVFALISGVAINGANPKCSYDQLKGFQKTKKELNDAQEKGEWVANKTSIDVVKNSLRGNQWPNQDEIEGVLDQMFEKLNGAAIVDENPSAAA
jgi:hypothetical protein